MKKFTKISDIENVISPERANTFLKFYENEKEEAERQSKAYQLYQFNCELNGLLLEVINWYEVILRNSIIKVIKYIHHPYGIFASRFFSSLNEQAAYSFVNTLNSFLAEELKYKIEKDANSNRRKSIRFDPSLFPEGKVVAELKFVFWENLLTNSYVNSIWKNYYKRAFSNMKTPDDIHQVYEITKSIRDLRNRVCHHEPNFKLDINELLGMIKQVFDYIDLDLYQVINEKKLIDLKEKNSSLFT